MKKFSKTLLEREKMYTKKNTLRVVSFMFAICLCLQLLSCQKDDASEKEINILNAKNNDFAGYGNYVFCEWGTIYRYNTKTETLDKACRDIECDGKCPLEGAMSTITGVYDARLYFCAWQAFTHKVFLAYQDINSGETKVLKTLEEIEDSGLIYTFIEEEYWYYKRMILKDGGDKTNPEDYEPYICRISLDGTKDEVFIKCDESEGVVMVGGGKIITNFEGILYSIDIETKKKSVLFDFKENDTSQIASSVRYVNGKIYFLALSNHTYISEITGSEHWQNLLFSVDVITGEIKKVLEEPITYFCITDDAIYYVPFKFRILYMPEDYEKNKDDLKEWLQDDTLYTCDLNGKNISAVYSNDKISYTYRLTVVDGVVYSWFSDYDEQAHTYDSKVFFGGIELESGRLIKTVTPEE